MNRHCALGEQFARGAVLLRARSATISAHQPPSGSRSRSCQVHLGKAEYSPSGFGLLVHSALCRSNQEGLDRRKDSKVRDE